MNTTLHQTIGPLRQEDVLALETSLQAAMESSDVAALDELIHDDLVFLNHEGRLVSKAEDLAMHRSGRLRFDRIDRTTLAASDYGNGGMVLASCALEGMADAQPFQVTLLFLRTWAVVGGKAQVVGLSTRIQADIRDPATT